MRVGRVIAFGFGVLVVVVAAGCDDKSKGGGATTTSSATPDDSASGDSTLKPVAYDKGNFPAKGSKPATTSAKRGGSGATAPSAASKKLSEAGTDRQMRKHAKVDMADCKSVPDNAAECDGDSLYYCDDKRLWVVDCNAEAKQGGVASGSCFEGETFTECLGCDKASDGSDVCCDFEMTICCAADGACYSPKG